MSAIRQKYTGIYDRAFIQICLIPLKYNYTVTL